MQKSNIQISGFSFEKRAASPEKKFKKKKITFSLFVQIRSSKRCAEFFIRNGSRDISLFVILRFR